MDKTRLKKLNNLSLQTVVIQICYEVCASQLEKEINHPLFLQLQEAMEVYEQSQCKVSRSKYEEPVMAAEQVLKQSFRGFYQHLLSKVSSLDKETADAAKLIRRQLKVTASAFERQKQALKEETITRILSLLRRDDLTREVALTFPNEMIVQLQNILYEFRHACELRYRDQAELRKIPSASRLRAPLIEAICKYHLHLYIDLETEPDEQQERLMRSIENYVDHGGTRKYTFRTRKPAQPKVKKRKKRKANS